MKNKLQTSSHNYRIPVQIGDVCCSIDCSNSRISSHLKKIYAEFLSSDPVDINIELETIQRFRYLQVDTKPPSAKIIKSFEQISLICSVNTDKPALAGPGVRVEIERQQLNPSHGYKFMNWLLRNTYYTVHNRKPGVARSAMLVHSCGIFRKRGVIVFSGPSGIGKTTIARLCGSEHGKVINDEMLLVSKGDTDGGRLMVQGIPIIGGVTRRLNVKAPLTCVMLLKQAPRTSIRPLDRVEAYLRIMRQVVAPMDLIEPDDMKAMLTEITGFC